MLHKTPSKTKETHNPPSSYIVAHSSEFHLQFKQI